MLLNSSFNIIGQSYVNIISEDAPNRIHIIHNGNINNVPRPAYARRFGGQQVIKLKRPSLSEGLSVMLVHLYQRRESNPHTRRYTILSRARLPVPPLWLGFASAKITTGLRVIPSKH